MQRNWELQFLGEQNKIELKKRLFQNKNLNQYVPKNLVEKIYKSFFEIDSAYYSHSLSMVLTLSQFFSLYNMESQDAK